METKIQIAENHLEMIRAKGGLNSFVELCEFNPDNDFVLQKKYEDE